MDFTKLDKALGEISHLVEVAERDRDLYKTACERKQKQIAELHERLCDINEHHKKYHSPVINYQPGDTFTVARVDGLIDPRHGVVQGDKGIAWHGIFRLEEVSTRTIKADRPVIVLVTYKVTEPCF